MTAFDSTIFVPLFYCAQLSVSMFFIAFVIQCCKKKKKAVKEPAKNTKDSPSSAKSGYFFSNIFEIILFLSSKEKPPVIEKAVDKPLLPGASKTARTAATTSKSEAITAKSKIGDKSAMAKTAIQGSKRQLGLSPKPEAAATGTPGPSKPPAEAQPPLPKPPSGALPPLPPDSAAGIKSKKEDIKSKKEDIKSKKEDIKSKKEDTKSKKDEPTKSLGSGEKSDVGLRSDKASPEHSDKGPKEGIIDEPSKEEDKKEGDEGGAEKAENKEEKSEDKEEE
ncbi:hypothetical protein Mgra_00002482 [Meloidogyne graminicola]|uniref:Uncharacterized protein n=1 Tax=Meloidogyne graminicola TaxID=189291 RepID=A0A8S9ZY21_9BILA|nr:hypothetical protein Mgra_00002482 [Meloidogyne graminicola]